MNRLADGLADVGRRGLGAPDPSQSELFAQALPGRPSFVTVNDIRVFDRTRTCIPDAVARQFLRRYLADKEDFVLTMSHETALAAFFGGKHRLLHDRAVGCKYVLGQLATRCRRAAWHYNNIPDTTCPLFGDPRPIPSTIILSTAAPRESSLLVADSIVDLPPSLTLRRLPPGGWIDALSDSMIVVVSVFFFLTLLLMLTLLLPWLSPRPLALLPSPQLLVILLLTPRTVLVNFVLTLRMMLVMFPLLTLLPMLVEMISHLVSSPPVI